MRRFSHHLPTIEPLEYQLLRAQNIDEAQRIFGKNSREYHFFQRHTAREYHAYNGAPVVVVWPDGHWAPCYEEHLRTYSQVAYLYSRATAFSFYSSR